MVEDRAIKKAFLIGEGDKYKKGKEYIDVKIYYIKGSTTYFAGVYEPRGYYLSITPYTREGNWRSYIGFSGAKRLLLPTKRYSKKKLEHIWERYVEPDAELLKTWFQKEDWNQLIGWCGQVRGLLEAE